MGFTIPTNNFYKIYINLNELFGKMIRVIDLLNGSTAVEPSNDYIVVNLTLQRRFNLQEETDFIILYIFYIYIR